VFAVLVPVGPGDAELERFGDLLDSIRAHEPAGSFRLIVVDDGPVPRDFGTPATVIRTALWTRGRRVPDPLSAMVAGTIEGLRAAAGAEFLVKLDTDALVIAPFADAVRRALDGRGIVGSYDVMSNGRVRTWDWWPPLLERAARPVQVFRPRPGSILPRVALKRRRDRRMARRVLREAVARGYQPGAHCLGGAYAVSPALLARDDLLSWRPWVGSDLGEDVVVGVLAGAAGLPMASAVGPGEPFGVQQVGLPDEPETLVARGHSIIHSIKDSEHAHEHELRAWFRARRAHAAAPNGAPGRAAPRSRA
jgi:hypothetical protein